MKYSVCVLLLAVCCAAQTANAQVASAPAAIGGAAIDAPDEAISAPSPQGHTVATADQSLAFPAVATDPSDAASGQDKKPQIQDSTAGQPQATPQSTTKQKKSANEPAWEWATGVSIGVAYTYTTGSPGIGGFNLGAGYRFKRQIEVCTDMDFGNSTVVLQGTTSKTKRQNYLFGGRYYIGKALAGHSKFEPFGHLMYGVTHQSIDTTQGIPVTSEISTAATTWTWDFGGGFDYLLSSHWAIRGRVDWLRTHFDSLNQNHFKWGAGFWYSFTARKMPK
jgi:hypothetical protein